MPTNLDWNSLKEVRRLPRNGCFYAEYVYQRPETLSVSLNACNALGIDHGIDNWLTCVSTVGTSFIIDGRHLKSKNQWYNKRVAALKKGQPQGFWSKQLAAITEKRNRQMRDAVNHCLKNRIGTVNTGQKDGVNMGAKTNQNFVQIPTGRVKERIKQLCEQYGLRFVETEESYTSRASFLDSDKLPKIGEKPEQWQESGKRVKRGLYRTATNWYINADCNAAANILRKVSATLGLDLSGVSKDALTTPLRVRLWTHSRTPAFRRGNVNAKAERFAGLLLSNPSGVSAEGEKVLAQMAASGNYNPRYLPKQAAEVELLLKIGLKEFIDKYLPEKGKQFGTAYCFSTACCAQTAEVQELVKNARAHASDLNLILHVSITEKDSDIAVVGKLLKSVGLKHKFIHRRVLQETQDEHGATAARPRFYFYAIKQPSGAFWVYLESMNRWYRWYNKRVAALKKGQPQGFWSKQLAAITEKRNRQMRDAINHCLKNRIGTVNTGQN